MYNEGEKMICIRGGSWYQEGNPELLKTPPFKNEIVTLHHIEHYKGSDFAVLVEYRYDSSGQQSCFGLDNFRPLQGSEATSELTSSFKEVIEKSDLISVPEKELTHS